MKNLKLFSILFLSVVLLACDKDDEKPDAVAQAAGTYNYKLKFYVLDGTQLLYLGSSLDESGTAIVTKTTQGFEVKEGGEVQFVGSKVATASNGFTFDIESQTVDVDGDDVVVEGFDGATLGSVKYNGLYESASKKLTGYLKFDGIFVDEDGNEFEATIVMQFVGTKV